MSSSILIFGYDDRLLRTRRWLLEGRGYRVWTISNLTEAAQMVSAPDLELLILCQTLTVEDYEGALALAHSIRPGMGVLVMDADGSKRPEIPGVTLLRDFPSPETFVAMVRKAVKRPEESLSGAF